MILIRARGERDRKQDTRGKKLEVEIKREINDKEQTK
jgi:hypothetical protein